MEDNSRINVNLEGDVEVSADKVIVDGDKVNGVVNENEEMEPPNVGMVFGSQEEVRCYYDKYAWQLGFTTIRKSTKSGDDGNVKYFTLACARSGKELSATNNHSFNFRKRLPPRTNCKAKINITIGPDGRVYVCRVVLEHNHELIPGLQGLKTKKLRGPRAKNKIKVTEKVQTGSCLESQSIVHEAVGSETLTSDSVIKKATDSNELTLGSRHIPFPKTRHSGDGNVANGSKRRSSVPPNPQLSQDALEHTLARRAVELVKSGMVIALGSGSTITLVIEELSKLIKEGKLKNIIAVGANYHSRLLARQFGVTMVDPNGVNKIDIAFDGVDEVDFNKNLLKRAGTTYTMQKVIDSVANECIILADYAKVVHQLGSTFPVPVEVLPPALSPVLRRLATFGGVPEIRSALTEGGPLFTDLGNMVVDVRFPNGIQNPAELEKNIKLIPGVVENGIIAGAATTVLVAVKDRGTINVMNLEEYVRIVLGRRDSS